MSDSEVNRPQSPTRHWAAEWQRFRHALLRSRDPFHPWEWIYRLSRAAVRDLGDRASAWSAVGRPFVPAFALLLILAVTASYFGTLRHELVQIRWCCPSYGSSARDRNAAATSKNNATAEKDDNNECLWMKLHDGIVVYLVIMILFHFLRTMLSSPGYVITEELAKEQEERQRNFPGLLLDAKAERQRKLLVHIPVAKRHGGDDTSSNNTIDSSAFSFCQKCQAHRPPRSHHCRVCQRCILQFDHHCLWLNNCIGFGNHRSFVLTLFFISVACWYGVMILYKPFYEPLQEHLRQHGGSLWKYLQLMYFSNDTLSPDNTVTTRRLLDIPSLTEMSDMLSCREGQTIPVQAVVDVIFPLLLGVGAILASFAGMHVHYILTAHTTLEHRIRLDHQWRWPLFRSTSKQHHQQTKAEHCATNPYNQGYYQNWIQIMGSNWFYLLLPLPVDPPPPHVLTMSKKKEQ